MKQKFYFLSIAITLLAMSFANHAYAQPPEGAEVIGVTVTSNATVKMRFYADTNVKIWVETSPGTYVETIPNGKWSTATDFAAVGTTIKVHGAVIGFDCDDNNDKITGLDFSGHSWIPVISFNNNSVSEVDFSHNSNISQLFCANNNLTSLDLMASSVLKYLYCQDNQIVTLNVSPMNVLESVAISSNQLSDCSLNDFYEILPSVVADEANFKGILYNVNNPGTFTSNTTIAADKGWINFIPGDASGCQTGLISLQELGVKTRGGKGVISIDTALPYKYASIFNVSGQLVRTVELKEGASKIPSMPGVYIVKVSEGAQKVVVQ